MLFCILHTCTLSTLKKSPNNTRHRLYLPCKVSPLFLLFLLYRTSLHIANVLFQIPTCMQSRHIFIYRKFSGSVLSNLVITYWDLKWNLMFFYWFCQWIMYNYGKACEIFHLLHMNIVSSALCGFLHITIMKERG